MEAPALAEQLLRDVGSRLAHSAAVAGQAQRAAGLLDEAWRDSLVDAAWLHDVGYAPPLARCGFHPLDGARWLREAGWRIDVCRLVAGHSRALTEARLRGLDHELIEEFDAAPVVPAAALTWADMTSDADGESCTLEVRLTGILDRYGSGPVRQAALANEPALRSDVSMIEDLLRAQEAGRR